MSDVHGVAFVGSVVLLGGAWLCWWLAAGQQARVRVMDATPTVPIAGAPQGLVEFQGTLQALPDGLLRAPMSGRPCVWWRFRIEVGRRDSSEDSYSWELVDEGSSALMLLLTDHSGECLIDIPGASFQGVRSQSWQGHSNRQQMPGTNHNFIGRPRELYRYVEDWLQVGDPLYALGELCPAGSVPLSMGLSAMQKEVQYQWQREHERAMLDHFDLNHDDWLDDQELAALAHDGQLEAGRRIAQIAAQLPRLDCLCQPAAGQPFLLSRRGEAVEKLRLRLGIAGLYLLAGSLIVGLVWLWQRVIVG